MPLPLPTNCGSIHFRLRDDGDGLKSLCAMCYPATDAVGSWVAIAQVPFTISGFMHRYKVLAQGSVSGTNFKLYSSFGVDMAGGVANTNPGTPTTGHLTAVLSTNRGAMPRVFAGPLIYSAEGGFGDEQVYAEFQFRDVLDFDESFGIGKVRIERRIYNWTSSSAGAATIHLDDVVNPKLPGIVVAVETMPDLGAAPTTLYDITVKDHLGIDLCEGLIANRSASAGELVYLWHTAAAAARHTKASFRTSLATVNVTNAGSAKSGAIGFYCAVAV